MGYEHYWKRPPALDPVTFEAWAHDVQRVVDALPEGTVCGPDGREKPNITSTSVSFNGNERMSTHRDWYIARVRATGLAAQATSAEQSMPISDAGVPLVISQRRSDGSFLLWSRADGRGWLWEACKTRGKPYDVAVTASLILFAHHFPDSCRVSSDGNMHDWQPGLELAERATGLQLHVPIYSHKLWYPDSLPMNVFRAWSEDVRKVIGTTDVQLAGPDGIRHPMVSPSVVAFNGVGDEGYDPFYISYNHVPNDGRGHRLGWVHWECQTMGNAGKRYDEVVIAALILFAHHFFPTQDDGSHTLQSYAIFSKGDEKAWKLGNDLVSRATGVQKRIDVDGYTDNVQITPY